MSTRPRSVPEWPTPMVRLTDKGTVQVGADEVPLPEGMDADAARQWAAAAAAERYAGLGPLRYIVVDPDGTSTAIVAAVEDEAAQVEGRPTRQAQRVVAVAAAATTVALLVTGAYAALSSSQSAEPAQGDRRPSAAPSTPARGPQEPAPSSSPSMSTAPGFEVRSTADYGLAVPTGWTAHPRNDRGQNRYTAPAGDLQLIVVAGRDSTARFGADPMIYQRRTEPELAAYRAAQWTTATAVRTVTVGQRISAEGEFGWDDDGHQVLACNRALLVGDRYHVLLVTGPENRAEELRSVCEQAATTYQPR